jgi:hypothetical protein
MFEVYTKRNHNLIHYLLSLLRSRETGTADLGRSVGDGFVPSPGAARTAPTSVG